MLDTLPYADLLAIYNALAEKPVTRFDTRANGVRRAEALLEGRALTLAEALLEGRALTLAEAARLADVVLPTENESGEARRDDTHEPLDEPPTQDTESDVTDDEPSDRELVTIDVNANIAALVNAFIGELTKTDRPRYVTTFLTRLSRGDSRQPRPVGRVREMTLSQRTIIALCARPEGATGKELAEGCGWPSIAARATCQKIADRFGYTLEESPKANGRGISFRLIAKPASDEEAA
jgi:hypothetical protein